MDSANTTPILNQANVAATLNGLSEVSSNASLALDSNKEGSSAAPLASSSTGGTTAGCLATAGTVSPSMALKRKYSEKQLSGKQRKHHSGPVDNYTLKKGTALALTKTTRIETLINIATQLHKCTGLDVSVIIRDQTIISTHFTNSNTADRIRPLINGLFDCELIVKNKVAEQNCNIFGKDNNKRIKCFEPTGIKATITLDSEYEAELKKRKFNSRFFTPQISEHINSNEGKN